MAVFRKVGQGIGYVGGGLIGGAVKVTGKAVGSKWQETGKWIEEVGDGVKTASHFALDNAGQFLDGTFQGTYGALKKDEYYKRQGISDLKESATRTAKGIGGTIKYAADSTGAVYTGLKNGDKEQAITGLKNIGKVAVVSTMAIGVIDVIEGTAVAEAEGIETRNDHLNGIVHPDTGVLFVEKSVNLPDGQVVEGTFPVFHTDFQVEIQESDYTASDEMHFKAANEALYQSVINNPALEDPLGFSTSDIIILAQGETPEGFTWHHSEEPGVLQLVDEETHSQTAHTGGRSIWGGGTENR
ncbi:HNH endonuclease [Planococcus salinus]|uniref:HNH endonuclease n=1 Tax=Planococcus salinus TaxID=1848460 RepID=A0A3M8P3L6_9BACL|nr:HNH endonuclease [Planococcus salinus]RNF38262.1 HNH endonuclease [Planococcus salinus]